MILMHVIMLKVHIHYSMPFTLKIWKSIILRVNHELSFKKIILILYEIFLE